MPHLRSFGFSLSLWVCLRMLVAVTTMVLAIPAAAADHATASQLLRSGKFSEALSAADQFLATQPRDLQMRFLRGVILAESGRNSEGVAVFAKIIEDFPDLPEPYNNLAVLYAALGQHDKARGVLEAAIKTNPSYATAHANLGDVYARLASHAYSKALQLDAGQADVQSKLALIKELFAPKSTKAAPQLTAATSAASAPSRATTAPATQPTGEVEAAAHDWATAWSARDIKTYFDAYAKDFAPPGKMSRKAWEEERRARILGKAHISVKLSNLQVTVDGSRAVAKFQQAYSADKLNISSRKVLDLVKSGTRWLIVRESTGS